VQVSAEDFSPREVSVRVAEGAAARAQVLLFADIVVSGMVVAPTGDAVPGAKVVIMPEGASPGSGGRRAKGDSRATGASDLPVGMSAGRPVASMDSDDSGAFFFRDVPVGKYVLVVDHPDFVTRQEPFEIRESGAAPDLRVSLASGESLSGKVTAADGSPGAGVILMLRDPDGLRKQAQADDLGRFEFHGLKIGQHRFMVRDGGGGRPFSTTVDIKKGENRQPSIRLPAPAAPAAVGQEG
jgi:hypothetical protein